MNTNSFQGSDQRVFEVLKGRELQIFLKENEIVFVKVERVRQDEVARAEIDGIELLELIEKPLKNINGNIRIYCWTDCKITVRGMLESEPYQSSRNSEAMREYMVAHFCLDQKRKEALENTKIGPRVLVTGSDMSGKTSFCNMLLNYGLKLGWNPLFCDLDLNNEIAIPGSIAATVIDHIVPNPFMIDNSIILYNGTKNSDLNYYLFESQVTELAACCRAKLDFEMKKWKKSMNIPTEGENYFKTINPVKPTIFASGIIVHCPLIESSVKDRNIYDTIIKEFDINLVYVIENERLSHDIKSLCEKQKKNTDVILLSKLSGLGQNQSYREQQDQQKYNAYFKGPFGNFKRSEIKVNLSQYKLLQVLSSDVSSSILPIGMSSDLNLVIKEYTIEDELMQKVVAIISLEEKDINELEMNWDKKSINSFVDIFSKATVSFFGYINKRDITSNTITICGPCTELVHKYLLIGDLKFINI